MSIWDTTGMSTRARVLPSDPDSSWLSLRDMKGHRKRLISSIVTVVRYEISDFTNKEEHRVVRSQ